MIILLILIVVILVCGYIIFNSNRINNNIKDGPLITDLELVIVQLEIKPKSNKSIKYIANYLENIIVPNEEILAVATSKNIGGENFAIVTNRRTIFKSSAVAVEIITPLEKIQAVVQEGTIVKVNGNFIQLSSIEQAGKIVNLINKQIACVQTVEQAIKIENKIVTEENVVSQLQKLASLHEAKVLTDYEYSMKKQELLEKMK